METLEGIEQRCEAVKAELNVIWEQRFNQKPLSLPIKSSGKSCQI